MINSSKKTKAHYSIMMILFLTVVLFSACSNDTNPITANSEPESNSFVNPYPALTDEMLAAGLPDGFEFLQVGGRSPREVLDDQDCDSSMAARVCRVNQDRVLTAGGSVKLYVPAGALSETIEISMVMPSTCYAVVDCYPHPYQFNSPVEIVWLLSTLDLPDGFDYSTLVPWYVNDAGEYIPVEYELRNNNTQLVVRTDHFSRYIIGIMAR